MNLISSINEINAELIADFQKAFGNPQAGDPRLANLAKASTQGITQATGLVWFDLQTPAKNLFPVITPLRNMIPRVSGNGGTATNWRQVTDVNVGNMQPFVPEGGRGGVAAAVGEGEVVEALHDGVGDVAVERDADQLQVGAAKRHAAHGKALVIQPSASRNSRSWCERA